MNFYDLVRSARQRSKYTKRKISAEKLFYDSFNTTAVQNPDGQNRSTADILYLFHFSTFFL